MTPLRRLDAQESADAGLSLVEMLVTIVLFGIIGTVVATALISTQQTTRNVGNRGQDLSAVQVGVEEMSKLLRTAAVRPTTGTPDTAISTATSSTLSFYGYNRPGKAPSLITFTADATAKTLTETIATTEQCGPFATPSSWAYTASRSRVLARNLSSAAIFSYHSAPVASPVPTSYEGAVIANPSTSLALIDSVEINLSVDVASSPDIPSAAVTTQVNLPNQLVSADNVPESAC